MTIDSVMLFAKILSSCVATMIYWRQRAAIKKLREALTVIQLETESPTLWPEYSKDDLDRSWATVHGISVRALRGKRW